MALTEQRQEVTVRPLGEEDLLWTATLQRAALPHGFFTRLGPRFLRAYQCTFLDSPFGIALAAERESAPVGFLVGTVDADAHRDWVLSERRRSLARLGLRSLLARPHELARFVGTRSLRYARAVAASFGSQAPPRPRPESAAVLTHVAVLPEARRTGAGSLLAEAFAEEARARGARRARLTTLRDRDGAGDFWELLGWTPVDVDPDDDGRLHQVYEREL